MECPNCGNQAMVQDDDDVIHCPCGWKSYPNTQQPEEA